MKHIFESRITAIMAISGLVMAEASELLLWLITRRFISSWVYEVARILYGVGIVLLFFGLYFELRVRKHRKEIEVQK